MDGAGILQLQEMFAAGDPDKTRDSSQSQGGATCQFTPATIGKGNPLPDKEIPKARPISDKNSEESKNKDIWGDDEFQTVSHVRDARDRPDVEDTYIQVIFT